MQFKYRLKGESSHSVQHVHGKLTKQTFAHIGGVRVVRAACVLPGVVVREAGAAPAALERRRECKCGREGEDVGEREE